MFPWLGWLIALVFAIAYIQKLGNNTVKNNGASKIRDIPEYVHDVLDYVSFHGKPMENYVGGRKFYNREKRLPTSHNNSRIKYREWDVLPKIKGRGRGPERLVTGSIGSAYYTKDHYRTFKQIR